MIKLNNTGSFWQDSNGEYWSYDTKLTDNYKGYKIFNYTYYSATTRKHQCYVNRVYNYDIALHCCSYGNWDCLEMIKKEIQDLKHQLEKRQSQRNTEKKKQDIAELTNEINKLENILNKQEQEQKDSLQEFETEYNKLPENCKKALANSDIILETQEQVDSLMHTMKMINIMASLS